MTATLSARPRSELGKNAARALRRTGRVPAVVYGHGDRTQLLSLDRLELEKLLATVNVENTILDLKLEGDAPLRTLMREVQTHPYKAEVLHVDFLLVHADEKVKLDIPVRLSGVPVGVRTHGGVMDQILYSVEVECLPGDIPEAAELDVAGLEIGDSVRVRDLQLPGVKILNDDDLAIATVLPPTVRESEADEAAAASAEPEVIRRGRAEGEE